MTKPSALNVIKSDHIYKNPENDVLSAGINNPPEGTRFINPPTWCEVGKCGYGDAAALPEIVINRQLPYLPPKKREQSTRDRSIARLS